MASQPVIAILGASGLIGSSLAEQLQAEGICVRPIARRFTSAQKAAFGSQAIERGFVDLNQAELSALIAGTGAELVVNCTGVLQDGPNSSTADVHTGFVSRLLEAIKAQHLPPRLVHISIPGSADTDHTAFSQSKRAAENLIKESSVAHAVLRPGFVIAPNAFGGSALLRAIAALPVDLPKREAATPFHITAMSDITLTVRHLLEHPTDAAIWDVMSASPDSVGDVVSALRARLGGPKAFFRLSGWLMSFGAKLGDLASRLGWAPPIRTTALTEMRRGVVGDPSEWSSATGISPATLANAAAALPASIQEKWFGQLYLLKGLMFPVLVVFWAVSGLIALFAAFDAATGILIAHHVPEGLAKAITVISSLLDISIGLLIAFRRTAAIGLVTGILVSLGYMFGAAILTPDMWIEPLGALVKTFPAIILMLTALTLLDNR